MRDRRGIPCTATWAGTGPLEYRDRMVQSGEAGRPGVWTTAALALTLPFVVALCSTLWQAPFPIGDSVGIFEDVERREPASFLVPSSSYYRPLFYLSISAIWHTADSIGDALRSVRLLHLIPVTTVVLLMVWHLRPRTAIDAASALTAVAVMTGSPGFLGNLELPLSYTIVGMAAALLVWMLLQRPRRWWHTAAIVLLTVIAIGFKEQGLVIVPVVVAAWWMGAPGATRGSAAAVTVLAVAYVVFRLAYHDPSLPMFEQDVGYGFTAFAADEAAEQFGAFPYGIYAYNASSTIANVLFAEPTDGMFRFVRAVRDGQSQPWHAVYAASSLATTLLISWWGVGALRRRDAAWPADTHLVVALLLTLAASGALSFNYSRERLGAMAVVFYALASYYAVRAAALRAAARALPIAVVAAVLLMLVASAWQLRALYTIEFTRQRAVNTQREWITRLRGREADFADRPVYLRVLHGMQGQGLAPLTVERTSYPRWFLGLLGEY